MVSSKIIKFNGKKYEFRTDGRIFRQLSNGTWKETGKADDGNGYLRVKIARKDYKVHRIIWTVFNGPIPDGFEIDHINRICNDNRLDNLRLVTSAQNNHNRKDNVMVDELEAGMKHNSPEYLNAWAQKYGYEDFNHYQRVMYARSKAKAANP